MDQQTPKELLPDFYKQYNLPPDGGQSESFVKVEITSKLCFYIPNFDARRQAVLKHDVHHLVTGYASVLKGEAEISAWEIASNCTNYWAAFLINSQGLLMGLALYPLATFKAFKRGRRSQNLYQDQFSEETFLNMSIQDLKKALHLDDQDEKISTTMADVLALMGWTIACLFIAIFSIVLLPFFILYNLKLSLGF